MRRCSTTLIMAAMSKVLDNDDLLTEILLRVGFTTTLVRAALACKRWFHHISNHTFLHRFRELHPPRLLGLYVNRHFVWQRPQLIPLPPQPLELAVVIRHASSIMDTYQSNGRTRASIIDCRNGSVLVKVDYHDEIGRSSTIQMHNLLCPERGIDVVPKLPFPEVAGLVTKCQVLSKEEKGRLSYFCVSTNSTTARTPTVSIYRLQDGAWCIHNSIELELHTLRGVKYVLVANKIYVVAAWYDIVVLDMTASSFYKIPLPQGVQHCDGNTLLSRADDADSVYFIHVKKFLLRIWLYNMDGWLLVDTICLREMCASLNISDCNASLRINQGGDNVEFVFLQMGKCVLYLNTKCRTLHKVYEMTRLDAFNRLGDIYPLMSIWPPTFPTLK